MELSTAYYLLHIIGLTKYNAMVFTNTVTIVCSACFALLGHYIYPTFITTGPLLVNTNITAILLPMNALLGQ